MNKIKYKKIKPGVFQKISFDDVVLDTIKLSSLKEYKASLTDKLGRVTKLIKELEKLKADK